MANLHNLHNDIPFGDLPPAWTTFDLASFSRAKSLWDCQQSALQNALKTLWKYYKDDVVASIATAEGTCGVRASTLRQAQGPLCSDGSAVLTPLSEEDPSS